MTPSEAASSYRATFLAKPMMVKPANDDQTIQKSPANGLLEMPSAPAQYTSFKRHSSLLRTSETASEARHLWVIRKNDFPVALEACLWGKTLEDQVIKHSNLTGGADAHSGGEAWFIGDDRIVLNAASGRYGASGESEMGQIIQVFCKAGYSVASMGFDVENPTKPNVLLLGEPDWQVCS